MRFNVPPGWPSPPPGWVPDEAWQPDSSWPPAPAGWRFWLDDRGLPTAGPRGAFGAPPMTTARLWRTGGGALGILGVGIGLGAATSPRGPVEPAATLTVTAPAVTVAGPTHTTAGPTVTVAGPTVTATVTAATGGAGVPQPLSGASGLSAPYYANCSQAKAAGAAPLRRGEPGYREDLDRDHDGIACE